MAADEKKMTIEVTFGDGQIKVEVPGGQEAQIPQKLEVENMISVPLMLAKTEDGTTGGFIHLPSCTWIWV